MSLQIVIGRSKSGKTQFLLDNMCENSGDLYIVPEQFSFSAEKMLVERFGVSGLGNPQATSFARLAESIFSKYGGGAHIPSEAAYRMLVSYSANTLKGNRLHLFDGLVKKSALGATAAELITTFRKYRISVDMLERAAQAATDDLLRKKLADSALIYREYLTDLSLSGADDRHNALSRLADFLNGGTCDYFSGRNIFIDNFSAFDPSEYECVKALLRLAPTVCVSLCTDECSPFETVRRTRAALLRAATDIGCPIKPDICLPGSSYGAAPMLSHLEKAYFADETMRFCGSDSSLGIFCAKDKLSEIQHVAKSICTLLKNGVRYRDISVVARDIESYKPIIDRVFPDYSIPVFLDRKIPLSGHCITLFVMSVLEIILYGFKYETVFAYIKSPFSPVSPPEADELENYCLAAGISKYGWSKPFLRRRGTYSSDKEKSEFISEEDLARMNVLREKVYLPLAALKKRLDDAASAREYTDALLDFLQELSIEDKVSASAAELEKIGENLAALQTVQVYNIFSDILNDITSVISDKSITLTEFCGIIRSGTDCVEIGTIPDSVDCVSAGSIDRIKGHNCANVFLIGVNASVFPAVPSSGGLFSDADKQALSALGIELPPDSVRKAQNEELLVYNALTCANERLYLSYPLSDFGQNVLMPSEIINRITEIFPDIDYKNDISECEAWLVPGAKKAAFDTTVLKLREHFFEKAPLTPELEAAAAYFQNNDEYRDAFSAAVQKFNYSNAAVDVSSALVASHLGEDMRTSISRLEAYNKCPFSFYSKYLLRLEPKKIFEVSVSDSGSFLHDFLESFSSFLSTAYHPSGEKCTWQNIDAAFIKQHTPTVLREVLCGVNEGMLEIPRINALFKRLCAVALQCVLNVWRHIKAGDFIPLGYEISFDEDGSFKPIKIKLPDGKGVTLRGRIDRADCLELKMPDNTVGRFARIIDYKSGEKTLSLDDVYSGVSLQLFVYLSSLCENGYRPAGILYCTLSDPIVSVSPNASEDEIRALRDKKLRMRGVVLEECDMNRHMGGDAVISTHRTMTERQFNKMFSHLRKTVAKTTADIYSGKFPILPENDGCAYCDYKSLCRFGDCQSTQSQKREKLSDEEILSLLDDKAEKEEC